MSDFTTRPITYYSGFLSNQTQQPIPAFVNEQLVAPLVKTTNDYQVALSKMKIPLSEIPIGGQSKNIIPLKQWQITLQQGTGNDALIGQAFVPQPNPINGNLLFNATLDQEANLLEYTYNFKPGTTIAPNYKEVKSIYLDPYINQMVIDDYGNSYVSLSSAPNGIPTILSWYDPNGNFLDSLNFTNITCFTIDPNQSIVVATDTTVYVYTNINGVGSVSLTLAQTITTNFNSINLSNIVTVASDGQLIVGYNVNQVTIYNSNFEPINDYTESQIVQLGQASQIIASANRFVLTDTGLIDETFFGLKTGANTLVDMLDSSTYNTACSFQAGCCVALTPNGTAVGIEQTTLNTISFTPNTLPGSIAAAKTTLSVGSLMNNCVAFPGTNNFMSNGTSSNSKYNYGWSLDNLSNQYFIFDYNFHANASDNVLNYAMYGNQLLITSAATKDMQISNLPYFPKQVVIDYSPEVVNPKTIVNEQFGFGWNQTTSATQSLSVVRTNTFASADVLQNCDYILLNSTLPSYAFNLVYDRTASQLQFNTLNISNQSTGTSQVILKNTAGVNLTVADWAHCVDIGNNCFALSGGFNLLSVDSNQKILIYNYGGTTPIYEQAWGSLNPNVTQYIASIVGSNGKNYLAIFNSLDNAIRVLDVTVPATPVIQQVIQLSPLINVVLGLTIVNLGTIATVEVIGGTYQVIVYEGCGIDFTTTPTAVGAYPSGILPNTSFEFNYNSLTYNQINVMQSNNILEEFYVLTLTGNLVSGYTSNMLTYKFQNSAPYYSLTSTINFPQNSSVTPACSFFSVAPNVTNYTTFSNVTLTSIANAVTGVSAFSASPVHPNSMYIVNLADSKVYKGILNVSTNTLSNLTLFNPLDANTFTTINILSNEINLNSQAYFYKLSTQLLDGTSYLVGNSKITSIARNTVTSEFLLALAKPSANVVSITSATGTTTVNYTSTLPNIGVIWAKNSENLDAGPFPIYTYEPIIAAINVAFTQAWTNLKARGGGVAPNFATAPFITYDSSAGYLTMNYTADLSASGGPSNFIYFNNALYQYLFFNSIPNSNYGYQLLFPTGSTTYQQTTKSLFLLNTLETLYLSSDTIFVDLSFQANNSQNRNITSIDVPIDQFYSGNYGQILYFSPNFLRTFHLSSDQAIINLTFRLTYLTTDGSLYQVNIPPNSAWTFLISFVKKTM